MQHVRAPGSSATSRGLPKHSRASRRLNRRPPERSGAPLTCESTGAEPAYRLVNRSSIAMQLSRRGMTPMYPARLLTSVITVPLLLATSCAYHNTPNGTVLGTAPLTWTFPVAPPPSPFAVASPMELGNPSPSALGIPENLPLPAPDLTGVYSGTAVSTYNPRPASD